MKTHATRARARPAACALAAAALILTTAADPAAAEGQARAAALPALVPTAVGTTRVELSRIAETLTASGSLVARRELQIGSELSGLRVAEVLVDEGQRIARGEIIARLDTALLEAQLKQKEAGVAKATASIAQQEASIRDLTAMIKSAEADFRRVETLRPQGVVTQNVFDQREAAFRSAEAKLDGARQALLAARAELAMVAAEATEVRARLAKAVIRAPMGGIVSKRAIEPGAVLAAGADPLVRIIEEGTVELALEVPDLELARIEPQQHVRVTIAGGLLVEGRVRHVAPTVDAKTRLGLVHVALPEDRRLRPGAYGRAEITIDARDRVSLPLAAVTHRGGVPTVTVIIDGRAVFRGIETGSIQHGSIEVRSGLSGGETVVVGGGAALREGAPVALVNSQSPAER